MSAATRRAALADVCFALADPTRLHILELVARAPRRASELAEEIGTSRPSISRHLRILRAARVLRDEGDEADGRATRIALAEGAFADVRGYLDEVEGFWSSQLAAFASLAADRGRRRAARRRAS